MATTYLRLCKGVFTNSKATIYTCTAKTLVKAVTLCNKTAGNVTVTLLYAGTNVIFNHVIAAYDTITVPFFDQMLLDTELIEGNASANTSIEYYISGATL